jgi:hypothetical protein
LNELKDIDCTEKVKMNHTHKMDAMLNETAEFERNVSRNLTMQSCVMCKSNNAIWKFEISILENDV